MSDLEELFLLQLKGADLPFEREFRFCSWRKWRADFVVGGVYSNPFAVWDWKTHEGQVPTRILVEIEGSSGWAGFRKNQPGDHRSVEGFQAGCEKYGTAAALGWRVIRLTPKMVRDGSGLRLVEAALGLRPLQAPDPKPKPKRRPKRPTGSHRARGRSYADLPERVKARIKP